MSEPISFGPGDTFRVEIQFPPSNCKRCGKEIPERKVFLIDPHHPECEECREGVRADGSRCAACDGTGASSGTAYWVACEECAKR